MLLEPLRSSFPTAPPRCHRVFNIQQSADALLGYPAVRKVEYNPVQNPTRLVSVTSDLHLTLGVFQ